MRIVPTTRSHLRPLRSACLTLFSVTLLWSAASAVSAQSALPDAFDSERLLWELEFGSHQYTVPRVDRGYLYVGVNDLRLEHPAVESTGGGVLYCLDVDTGKQIWQFPVPRNMDGRNEPFHFNHWKCGVCSRPAVEEDRLFIVGPRGDVLCLDRNGQSNGNDGPFRDELSYLGVAKDNDYQLQPSDGDVLWRFDLIQQLGVVPHDVCGSCTVLHGDYLYVCTSNGVDGKHNYVANPEAPSLIALNKHTGQLAATDGELLGDRIFHGQWSSPVVGEFDGQQLLLFGGGDGVLYAFRPLDQPIAQEEPETLQVVWQYDCCPQDYRVRDGKPVPYSRHNRRRPDGPSEIIATPIIHNGHIYASIGQSPVHGPGRGILSCIDGATGQKVWDTRDVGRTLSDVVIHDGLVYASDFSGNLTCLDADTGQTCWQHDLEGGVWCASPVIVNDQILVSNERNLLWILETGREKNVVSRSRVRSVPITPVIEKNILLFPTQRRLFAVQLP